MATKKPKQHKSGLEDEHAKNHIQQLGLGSVREYQEWCRKHGFSRNTNKTSRQRSEERLMLARSKADIVLSRKRYKDPIEALNAYFADPIHINTNDLPLGLRNIGACELHKLSPLDKQAFQKLALSMHECIGESLKCGAMSYPIVKGLVSLAKLREDWIRQPDTWKPLTHNTRRRFSSLVRHLLAQYYVPQFMDVCFLENNLLHQIWFIHIGQGQNIRKAMDLPISLTKMMAHHFLKAPTDYTVAAALRWGQVFALGGDARLANALRNTRMERAFDNDDFWSSVIRWFIVNPMLDTHQIGPIIDYLFNQRFAAQRVFVGPGREEHRGPEQPHLAMKDRDPVALIKQMESWHRKLGKTKGGVVQWESSGYLPFALQEGDPSSKSFKVWRIYELLSQKELTAEGREMGHCVASYAGSCAAKRCSIWSMICESHDGVRKILTIEVNAQGMISQARGKLNEKASSKVTNIMARWAQAAGLHLSAYL